MKPTLRPLQYPSENLWHHNYHNGFWERQLYTYLPSTGSRNVATVFGRVTFLGGKKRLNQSANPKLIHCSFTNWPSTCEIRGSIKAPIAQSTGHINLATNGMYATNYLYQLHTLWILYWLLHCGTVNVMSCIHVKTSIDVHTQGDNELRS